MNMLTDGVITMTNNNCNGARKETKDCTRMTYTNSNEENEGRKYGRKTSVLRPLSLSIYRKSRGIVLVVKVSLKVSLGYN